MQRLDLQVTESARAWIAKYLSSYEPDAVLALSFKTYIAGEVAKDHMSTRLRFVVFSKDQVEQIEATSLITGEGLYVTDDGVTLCIPERRDCERLFGRTLDVVDGALLVRERAS